MTILATLIIAAMALILAGQILDSLSGVETSFYRDLVGAELLGSASLQFGASLWPVTIVLEALLLAGLLAVWL